MGTQARRFALNLTLLLVVAGLGAWVWWQAHTLEAQAATLLTLEREAITRIAITRELDSDKPSVMRLEKQGDHWQMLEPKAFALNPTRISQLFTLLDEAVAASYPAAGKDLKAYGLEPGTVAVMFNDQRLIFGAENPVSHNRYVLHDGAIKLVSETVFGLMTGTLEDWFANKLVPPGRSLQSVSLPQGYASQQSTLQNWQSADAVRVEAWDGKDAGHGAITLKLDNGSELALVLLTTQGELLLGHTAAGIRYVLPEVQRGNLLPSQ